MSDIFNPRLRITPIGEPPVSDEQVDTSVPIAAIPRPQRTDFNPNRVNYGQITNPYVQKAYAGTIQAQARDDAQQFRDEQAQAADQRRQQAEMQRQQEEQQKQAVRVANAETERAFKTAQRPYYKDETGQIVAEHDDSTWNTLQEQKKNNAARESQWRAEQRPFYKDDVTGDLVPTQPDEVWHKHKAELDAKEAEEARATPLRKSLAALDAETSDPGKMSLNVTDRKKLEKQYRDITREAVNTHLLPKLSTAGNEQDTGVPFWPFDNKPTDAATGAKERLNSINERMIKADTEKSPVALDDADMEDLSQVAPGIVDTLSKTKAALEADDANRAWHDEKKKSRFDLEMRLKNPAKWEEMQHERINAFTNPKDAEDYAQTLQEHTQSRIADLESRKAELAKHDDGIRAEIDSLEAQNGSAQVDGIPADKLVILTNPATGEEQSWHADLAAQRRQIEQRAGEQEKELAPIRRALPLEAKSLDADISIVNAAHAKAQDAKRTKEAEALDKLRLNPSLAPAADQFAALRDEGEQRRGVIDAQYPEDSRERTGAMQALQGDLDTKYQQINEGIQAKQMAGAQVYDVWKASKAGLTPEDIKKSGLTEEEAHYWTEYYKGRDFNQGNKDDKARVLADGSLAVNPLLWTKPEDAKKAIAATTASESEKARMLEQLPALEEQGYASLIPHLPGILPFAEKHGATALVPGATAYYGPTAEQDKADALANAGYKSSKELVEAYRKENGWAKQHLQQLLLGAVQGTIGMAQQAAGITSAVTGSAGAMDFSSKANKDIERLGQSSAALENGQWTAKLAQGATSILPALAGGMALGTVGRLVAGAKLASGAITAERAIKLAESFGLAGGAGAGGLQSFGSTFGEAFDAYKARGMSEEQARSKAWLPALGAGLSTVLATVATPMALSKAAPGIFGEGVQGIESAGIREATRGLTAKVATTGKQFIKGLLKGAASEFPEEALDQLVSGIITKATYEPNKSWREIINESLEAGVIGAALGGSIEAATGGGGHSEQPTTPVPVSKFTPEAVAAARAQIDGYLSPTGDPTVGAHTQTAAKALLEVAQGNLSALKDSDLALLDLQRNSSGELENAATKDGRPPRVKVENGIPIISQPTLDNLEKTFPALRSLIGMDETQARAYFHPDAVKQREADAKQVAKQAEQKAASDKKAAQVAAASTTSQTAPQQVAGKTTQRDRNRTLAPEEAERVKDLTTFLTERGVAADHAADFADYHVREQGITNPDYRLQAAKDLIPFIKSLGGGLSASSSAKAFDNLQVYKSTGKDPVSSTGTTPAKQVKPAEPHQTVSAAPATKYTSLADAPDYSTRRADALKTFKDKLTAKGVPDVAKAVKGASNALIHLDTALARYSPLIPNGWRFATGQKGDTGIESGGGLGYNANDGRLIVDMDTFLEHYGNDRKESKDAITAVVEEELIHSVAAAEFKPAEVVKLWKSLLADKEGVKIARAVYRGYNSDTGAGDGAVDDIFEAHDDNARYQMGHEFLRMLAQNDVFRGRVTEAINLSPSLGQKIIDFLKGFLKHLDDLITKAPKGLRADIQTYRTKLNTQLTALLDTLPKEAAVLDTKNSPAVTAKTEDDLDYTPPATAAVKSEDVKTSAAAIGNEVNIILPDGTVLPARYELVEAGDVHLAPNNDRDYSSGQEVGRIEKQLLGFKPELILNNNPTPDTGPSMADIDGELQGGNRRYILATNERVYPRYRAYLFKHAEQFGFTGKDVTDMKRPVLIRRILTQKVDLNRALNNAAVGDIGVVDNALSAARVLTDEARTAAMELFEGAPDTAPLATLQKGNTRDLVKALLKAGAIRPNERSKYVSDGKLTDEGARLVRYVLLADVVPDKAVLQQIGDTPLETKLIAAIPAVSKARARGVDITPLLEATRMEVDRASVKGKKAMSIDDYQSQQGLGFTGDTSDSARMVQRILGETASKDIKRVFAALSATVAPIDPEQPTLTGEQNRATLGDVKPEELESIRKGVVSSDGGTLFSGGTLAGLPITWHTDGTLNPPPESIKELRTRYKGLRLNWRNAYTETLSKINALELDLVSAFEKQNSAVDAFKLAQKTNAVPSDELITKTRREVDSILSNIRENKAFLVVASEKAGIKKPTGLLLSAGRVSPLDLTPDEVVKSLHDDGIKDQRTRVHSLVAGPRVSTRARQALSARNHRRLGQAQSVAREVIAGGSTENFSGPSSPESAHRRLGVPIIRLPDMGIKKDQWGNYSSMEPDRFERLKPGSEAQPYLDKSRGVVYKIFVKSILGKSGKKFVARKNAQDGWTTSMDDDTPVGTLDKLALLHDVGGLPTELVGVTPQGHWVATQPRATHLDRNPDGSVKNWLSLKAQAATSIGAVKINHPDFDGLYVLWHDGKPQFLGDLHTQNIMNDVDGNPTVMDAVVGEVPEELMRDVPEVQDAVNKAKVRAGVEAAPDDEYDNVLLPSARRQREFSELGASQFLGELFYDAPTVTPKVTAAPPVVTPSALPVDMFAGRPDEPFNLAAESADDKSRREARDKEVEKARQAKATEQARLEAEKQQTTLPLTEADSARIREDSEEAKPIIAEIDAITATAEERHKELSEKSPSTSGLIHPSQLLTSEEAGRMHELKMMLRSKSRDEAKADILKRRADRAAGVLPKAPVQPSSITDFGEKIHGAKKDRWGKFGRTMEMPLPENVSDISMAKHFPEPDYEKALADGVPLRELAAMKALRDMIPPKPRQGWKLRQWDTVVRALHGHIGTLVKKDNAISADKFFELLENQPNLKSAVDFYTYLGYPLFMNAKGFHIDIGGRGQYSYYRGEDLHNKIVVSGQIDGRNTDMYAVVAPGEEQAGWQKVAEKLKPVVERLAGERGVVKPGATGPKPVAFSIYTDNRTKDVFIGRKGAGGVLRIKTGFPDVKAARIYLVDSRPELEKTWADMKREPNLRKEFNDPRQGPARYDSDVTPDKFQEAFGFRGVQFGNYVEDNRRQTDLNRAFDSLVDLAEVLKVPTRAISLDGSLGLAFGARGNGGKRAAAAHYEPGEVVINLTKEAGPGSLAHEWFHALDNYFARFEKYNSTDARPYGDYASTSFNGQQGGVKNTRGVLNAGFAGIRGAIARSTFKSRSNALDETRSKPYFGTVVEMTARSFERYVYDRLNKSDITNDYLVNIDFSSGAYPTDEEMENGIKQAYDALFNAIESKDTGKGVMLHSAPRTITPVDEAAHEASTSPLNSTPEPTDAQKQAGNYTMGHTTVAGLDVTIENPAGSERKGTDKNGKPWSVLMKSHYGYIKGTVGKDGDHVDVMITPGTPNDYAGDVFIIDQVEPSTRKFDEHKVVIGATNMADAARKYLANYSPGWKGFGGIKQMSMDEFKTWLDSGKTTKPATNLQPKTYSQKTSTGRAQPLSEWITTPTGLVMMGNLKLGDEILAPDGESQTVDVILPQGVKPIYQVDTANGSARFTEDHLFVVKLDSPDSIPLNMRLAEIATVMQTGRTVLLPTM